MRKRLQALSFFALLMVWSSWSYAQPCSSLTGMGVGPRTYMSGVGTSAATARYFDFQGVGSPVMAIGYVTTGMLPQGACLVNGSMCDLNTHDFRCQGYAAGRYASFIFRQSKAAGADQSGNVCTFSTAMGATCRISGATGLPVELMEFSLEE